MSTPTGREVRQDIAEAIRALQRLGHTLELYRPATPRRLTIHDLTKIQSELNCILFMCKLLHEQAEHLITRR